MLIKVSNFSVVTSMSNLDASHDKRAPIIIGYSRPCEYTFEEQLKIVAEYHVYRIPAMRIAHRTGIDYGLVTELLDGDKHAKTSKRLITLYRKLKRQRSLKKAGAMGRGTERYAAELEIEKEFVLLSKELGI